ncbi:MAG: energy transducer TonB [Saprospiraceae bacterium]|nr:energy transducer TonB [Saprospiraceae bacterium]
MKTFFNSSLPLDELVFENRNKGYGAYLLRKSYADHLLIGIVGSSILVIGFFLLLSMNLTKNDEQNSILKYFPPIELQDFDVIIPVRPNNPIKSYSNAKSFTHSDPIKVVSDEEIIEEKKELSNENVKLFDGVLFGSESSASGVIDGDAFSVENETRFSVDDEPLKYADEMPIFNGGLVEMYKYLSRNIKYPVIARENGIEGIVIVNFVIDPFGKVSNVRAIRTIGGGCDEEAVRVISAMPNWIPGRNHGKTVSVSYSLPIKFKIEF